jgi:xanthine dehydrogenase YagR molybdenum-binding subunit
VKDRLVLSDAAWERMAPLIIGRPDQKGSIMKPSLAEYHVPVHMDVPAIEVIWNDIADPHSPLGVRGIGEIGITGVGAAVANAVYNATGKRIRELSITFDKLLTAGP